MFDDFDLDDDTPFAVVTVPNMVKCIDLVFCK
jgi:hypothetical protein